MPMDRPCQAGTEGAGADAGSNPEMTIATFTQVHAPASRPPWGRILNREGDTQAGAFAQLRRLHGAHHEVSFMDG